MPVAFIPTSYDKIDLREIRFRGHRLRIDDLGQFADERRS